MRILLSGSTGQLGGALATSLPQVGDIVAPDRTQFDLTDESSIRHTLDDIRPDLIVNAAAYTAVDQAESERQSAIAVNSRAPEIMAEWAAAQGIALLHYSTDYVFEGTGRDPLKEKDATNPINVYGESKRAGEIAIADSGARHLIIRTSWLYGPQGSNFLRTILRLAQERECLRIVDDQIGTPTPTWWLADISAQILQQKPDLFETTRCGILHAAPCGDTSWHGFAVAIVEGARKRSIPLTVTNIAAIPSSAYPTPAPRPAHAVFSLERLQRNFGITPPHWRNALEPVLDDVAQQGDFS